MFVSWFWSHAGCVCAATHWPGCAGSLGRMMLRGKPLLDSSLFSGQFHKVPVPLGNIALLHFCHGFESDLTTPLWAFTLSNVSASFVILSLTTHLRLSLALCAYERRRSAHLIWCCEFLNFRQGTCQTHHIMSPYKLDSPSYDLISFLTFVSIIFLIVKLSFESV